jgi:hypothetical protein
VALIAFLPQMATQMNDSQFGAAAVLVSGYEGPGQERMVLGGSECRGDRAGRGMRPVRNVFSEAAGSEYESATAWAIISLASSPTRSAPWA